SRSDCAPAVPIMAEPNAKAKNAVRIIDCFPLPRLNWPLTAIIAARRRAANERVATPPFESSDRRGGRLFGLCLLNRPRILPFGFNLAIDKFDPRFCRIAAIAESRLHDTGVAAVAALITRTDDVEELLDLRNVADFRHRLTTRSQSTLFRQRHQLLNDRTQFFRLWQRGDDLFVLDQRGSHIGEHGLAMLCRAVELAVNLAVTHFRLLRRQRSGIRRQVSEVQS